MEEKEKKKVHVILTTKGGREFSLTSECDENQLVQAAKNAQAKVNEKYAGTELEVTGYHTVSDEVFKQQHFTTLTTVNSVLPELPGE